jgi:hypothetical protein
VDQKFCFVFITLKQEERVIFISLQAAFPGGAAFI